ncbi:Protein of unknown function [Propionibacterium freudenreichii subsp. freudenreichii]|uniref:Uncharacterized protein n=1 Tax=Propionibacterium freudenreichii subsp. freudenreichii TaxID=66712 RepID=A0A0B7NZB9_PROFF|nr:Protein of unknown function [Propionibacterium freudenreichii subsp. freudenreichii]
MVTEGPPGRLPTPTSNLPAAAFCTPTSDPVEPSVAEQAPAARSSVPADEATPAHLPWYTESFTYCSAFTDASESQVTSKLPLADQPPP